MNHFNKPVSLLALFVLPFAGFSQERETMSFNHDWQFARLNETVTEGQRIGRMGTHWQDQFNVTYAEASTKAGATAVNSMDGILAGEMKLLEGRKWENVSLPHTAFIEPLVIRQQWQGVCYYKKEFTVGEAFRQRKIFLGFEGAMHGADVWVNGMHKFYHAGGYTPFTIDITRDVVYGKVNNIVIRLDNRDNPLIPPGKPVGKLDFNYYSGLYRDVHLIITGPVHITDPVYANKPSGGGIFVTYPKVTEREATVHVTTEIRNEDGRSARTTVEWILEDRDGRPVRRIASKTIGIAPASDQSFDQDLNFKEPHLWSPGEPYLYTLKAVVRRDGVLADALVQKIGIRHIAFTRKEGFTINGKPLRLEGSNRHMEYPYIGNALSHNANYRDMYLLKKAGMNIVRLSHYPQDPSVYDACDELGILAIDCIPGWQFYSKDSTFIRNSFKDIRDMVRRDRNHPCVILWEALLNESWPPKEWKNKAYDIVHEEYPGPECYTAGDMYGYYKWDVLYNDWKDEDHSRPNNSEKPGFIREYGDYEFGGGSSTSRVLRGQGERALLQQAWNLQWSHNRLRAQYPWTSGQSTWQLFDTNHGCCDDLSSCGMLDIFRLPKFSYRYFQSQETTAPIVFIADYWLPPGTPEVDTLRVHASKKVIVYSNCDEVALYRTDTLIARQKPDHGPDSEYGDYEKGGNPFDGGNALHLKHPPFTFTNVARVGGAIKAIGFIKGKPVTSRIVRTSGKPGRIQLEAGINGKPLRAGEADVIFIYANMMDTAGTLVANGSLSVQFKVDGPARIIGPSKVFSEAGIATILLQTDGKPGQIHIQADAAGIPPARLTLSNQ